MPAVGDVVELFDASVGVVSERVSAPRHAEYWRALFPESALIISPADIEQTLAAPSYQVGDAVEVWPHLGTIESVDGDLVTVRLDRSERIKHVGHIEWQPAVTVPLWRIILDNDTRLQRTWK